METEKISALPWRWCLVGNIVAAHEYGEAHEVRTGTKQFAPGAKVYLAPVQWGDGYAHAVVLGKPRHGRGLIELVLPRKYIANYRLQKVFRPAVLERMEKSPYSWWGGADADREEILKLLDRLAPAGETSGAGAHENE